MSILDEIRTYKLEEIAARKADRPLADIEAEARATPRPRGFLDALRRHANAGGYGLIGEIKKASPSKGLIREDFVPADLARAYEAGGAACLSVLTDAPSFQGAETYLQEAREASALPILRKDFLYDPWQVAETRALGADCILIIMATLSDAEADALYAAARAWELDALIEVHTVEELDRAKRLEPRLIGVNNRDLTTFETDLGVSRKLARHAPMEATIVAESGLATREDLADLARFGVRCFLIGETLMRRPDVEAATREILRSPWTPEAM